jgi:hypothetical protein
MGQSLRLMQGGLLINLVIKAFSFRGKRLFIFLKKVHISEKDYQLMLTFAHTVNYNEFELY